MPEDQTVDLFPDIGADGEFSCHPVPDCPRSDPEIMSEGCLPVGSMEGPSDGDEQVNRVGHWARELPSRRKVCSTVNAAIPGQRRAEKFVGACRFRPVERGYAGWRVR